MEHFLDKFEKENECFGTVTWTKEDLENALELRDRKSDSETVEKLYKLLTSPVHIKRFTDHIIDEGFNFIYEFIDYKFDLTGDFYTDF